MLRGSIGYKKNFIMVMVQKYLLVAGPLAAQLVLVQEQLELVAAGAEKDHLQINCKIE